MAIEIVFLDFQPQEDRLVLRVQFDQTSEMLFWLTRRLVRLLWPVLVKLTAAAPEIQSQPLPEARTAMVEMKREQALKQFTFNVPAQTKARVRVTGDTPLLITTVQSTRNQKGLIVLTLTPTEGASWDLTLNEKLLHALIKLLQDATTKAEWNLELVLPKGSTGSAGSVH